MTSKKQLALSSLITMIVLVCGLAISLGPAPETNAAPHPPAQSCSAANEGSFALTGSGFSTPHCPLGIYALWQCSENSNGTFSWSYEGRHCGPIVSSGF